MSLANPLWASLTTRHRALALPVAGGALRYPADVAPFVGLTEPAPVTVDDDVYFVGPCPPAAIPIGTITQMVCAAPPPELDASDIVSLDARIDAVLGLAALVYPHYFRPRTPELGRYFGIFAGDTLAAMVGERMGFPGHREISAVCTHPSHVGRGLARRLLVHLARDLHARGEEPFLHVAPSNTRAISLYEQNGFAKTRDVPFAKTR